VSSRLLSAARWLALASSAVILLGIAPSQILLALALVALLLSGEKLRLPPIKLPLALFLLGTIIAVIFSSNPTAGLPQIRKIYVFLQLLVVFSVLRELKYIRWLVLSWAVFATLSALRSDVQFAGKIQQAHAAGKNFYDYYVGERVTGFMSHWYTFSAQEMFALIMLGSLLFFSTNAGRRTWLWVGCGGLMALGLILGEMRGVWIATFAACLYLVWFWKRWLVVAVPVALAAIFFLSPDVIRERFTSIVHPSRLDSNEFRIVTWRTGLRMIEAHPWLGLGPEEPRIQFDRYVPADIPRPLPDGSYIHLHNLYLEYAAERGIPVLLIFLWLVAKMLRDFWRAIRSLPPGCREYLFLLHGAFAAVIAILVDGVMNVNLGDSELLSMFLAIIACGYIAVEQAVAPARERQEVTPAAA
jgi:putative inorganic carbon (hco3(-)) transporter